MLVNEVFMYNRDVTKELLGRCLGYSRDRDIGTVILMGSEPSGIEEQQTRVHTKNDMA